MWLIYYSASTIAAIIAALRVSVAQMEPRFLIMDITC